jgi:hypothetical protein
MHWPSFRCKTGASAKFATNAFFERVDQGHTIRKTVLQAAFNCTQVLQSSPATATRQEPTLALRTASRSLIQATIYDNLWGQLDK